MSKQLFMSLLIALLAAGIGLACDNAEDAAPASGGPAASAGEQDALPASLTLASEPEGSRSVSEVRSGASEGDTVVVRGVVGGREEPIAENRAILTLLDESVQTCDQMEMSGDGCQTPWDACCVPQETIAAKSATVQVVDAEGRPLKASLASIANLAPLSRIVVVGKYHPTADGQAATIEAQGIYVVP